MLDNDSNAVFERILSKELHFVDERNGNYLASLAINMGVEFPVALTYLKPYFKPLMNGRVHIYIFSNSDTPEKLPEVTLDLVWLLHGQHGVVGVGIPEILERLIKADPRLKIDRRLQSLSRRTVRW